MSRECKKHKINKNVMMDFNIVVTFNSEKINYNHTPSIEHAPY